MLVRLVLALVCSAVGLRYARLKRRRDGAYCREQPRSNEDLVDSKEIYTYADAQATKEEEVEVKHVSTVSSISSSNICQENDQLLLPELVDLFQGCIDVTSDSEKSTDRVKFGEDGLRIKYDSDESIESRKYESNSEDDEAVEIFNALAMSTEADAQLSASSAQRAELKALLASLQEKELKLEAELLECYGLKEREKKYLQLERQIWEKNKEIEDLNVKIVSLEVQAKTLSKEVEGKKDLKEALEVARAKVENLQTMIQSDAGQTKAQLLMLKQQVPILEEEYEVSQKDFDMERKLQTLKELEVHVLELRRTSKELQHQKRELTGELNAAEAKIIELSSVTESDNVAQAQSQVSALSLANEDLSKQVEGLQMNRFSEVEELVYLRWVNACLRYELRNHQAPPGKGTALDLGTNLSPNSQEKAKQLTMKYAGPDLIGAKCREHIEQDNDSISSLPSTMSECEFDDSSIDDLLWKHHSSGKKSGFINKLKKWGRSKEAPELSLAASSIDATKGRTQNPGHRRTKSRGSLESLFVRTSHEDLSTFGINGFEKAKHSGSNSIKSPGETDSIETRLSVDVNDLSSDVAASFELMSKSVFITSEEKYPPFKDTHVLALDREKATEQKADHTSTEELVKMPRRSEAASHIKTGKVVRREIEKVVPREIDKALPIMLDKHAPKKLHFDRLPQRVADLVLATESSPVRLVVNKIKHSEIQKREPRVPKPAPKASVIGTSDDKIIIAKPTEGSSPVPPPPPPPPPTRSTGGPPPPPPPPGTVKLQGPGSERVQRAPEVVEFYQSLMRRDAKKDTTMGSSEVNISDVRNNMIGEIENRSAFLLAVKADVETQGDFVQALAIEVRNAAYDDIEDVIGFVSWLDEELSFLVDERAVLKHFDWPESKADVFREAAFEYQDLKKLNSEISSFEDDPRVPCDKSLKQMLSLLEKVEQTVYAVLRTRDMAVARYKEFGVPAQWILDSGLLGKIKLATVQLARKYMERVALELDSSVATASIRDPHREFLLLQGVRFAFRVHQFAGGFDAESMHIFEELRGRVHACSVDHSANENT